MLRLRAWVLFLMVFHRGLSQVQPYLPPSLTTFSICWNLVVWNLTLTIQDSICHFLSTMHAVWSSRLMMIYWRSCLGPATIVSWSTQTRTCWCCCTYYIYSPLANIMNLSFLQGVYLSKLKQKKVIPVYKCDDDNDPGNYRPISLLSIFNRIFEKLMYRRLSDFFEKMMYSLNQNMAFVNRIQINNLF